MLDLRAEEIDRPEDDLALLAVPLQPRASMSMEVKALMPPSKDWVSFPNPPLLPLFGRAGEGKQGGNDDDPTSFSLLAPGSAAIDDSSLLFNPGSRTALRLIGFSVTVYVVLTVGVFALTPTALELSQQEWTAVVLTLSLQVTSLLHDAFACQRISESESDTHRCIIVVKVLAALTNTMLCFLPSTPFVLDMVTGRPNSMLRWVRANLGLELVNKGRATRYSLQRLASATLGHPPRSRPAQTAGASTNSRSRATSRTSSSGSSAFVTTTVAATV